MRASKIIIERNIVTMPTTKVDDGKVDIYYELHGEGPEKVLFITGEQRHPLVRSRVQSTEFPANFVFNCGALIRVCNFV